jgi:hypothetical protein
MICIIASGMSSNIAAADQRAMRQTFHGPAPTLSLDPVMCLPPREIGSLILAPVGMNRMSNK